MLKNLAGILILILGFMLMGCPNPTAGSPAAKSPYAGIWVNASYNGRNCQPSAKFVVQDDGKQWALYNNATDVLALRSIVVSFPGSYENDASWSKISDGASFSLVKIVGATLFINVSLTSYDNAYVTTTMNYSFTKISP